MLTRMSDYLKVVEHYIATEYREEREFLRVTKANAYTLVYSFQNSFGTYEITIQETDNPSVIIVNTSKIYSLQDGIWTYLCKL